MYQKYGKRAIDITLSLTTILLTLPLGIVVAILIKLDSKGPVLFTQERTGLNGELFKMYKFRTMACTNDVRDTSHENQITRIGRVARSLSLDEIPQMLNILLGQMSFIGPRPWIHDYYENMTTKQRQRVSVLPGVTGLAQVYGRNNLSINGKIKMDLAYVQHVTFVDDSKIFLKTIGALFTRTGQEISKFSIAREIETLKQQLIEAQEQVALASHLSEQAGFKTGATFYSSVEPKPKAKSKPKAPAKHTKPKKVATK